MFEFTVTATDGEARTGQLTTPHGVVNTPVFMPVGTHGAVKSVSPAELSQVGSQVILANTYHMYLRPGDGLVKEVGGLHQFMQWDGPILTDSGGFQVFSLGERGMAGTEKTALRSVAEEGITFHSHLDGSKHLFTPEKSIDIQRNLGADIIMAFDQPVYGLSDPLAAKEAMERSMRWLERSAEEWKKSEPGKQALFGIVQGGIHTDLHRTSAEAVAALDLPGNAIGGLSVGEGKAEMWQAVESINSLLPLEKPRYFMGLGEPTDLVEATLRGVDMYDCVSPSRLARHGAVWIPVGDEGTVRAFWEGDTDTLLQGNLAFERWNLNNARFAADPNPLVGFGPLPKDLVGFTRASLHHYIKEHEMLGYRILTLHNVAVLSLVTSHLANAIRCGKTSLLRAAFGL
ncbi:MAG: tRNA guanosine(34) transglycosylase Tgt [bacterium]